MNDITVPILRFPFLRTRSSTIGYLKVSSRHMNRTNPTTAVMVNATMALLANQSSSCPLSKMYCKEPTNAASNPIPIQSTSEAERFSEYLAFHKL